MAIAASAAAMAAGTVSDAKTADVRMATGEGSRPTKSKGSLKQRIEKAHSWSTAEGPIAPRARSTARDAATPPASLAFGKSPFSRAFLRFCGDAFSLLSAPSDTGYPPAKAVRTASMRIPICDRSTSISRANSGSEPMMMIPPATMVMANPMENICSEGAARETKARPN